MAAGLVCTLIAFALVPGCTHASESTQPAIAYQRHVEQAPATCCVCSDEGAPICAAWTVEGEAQCVSVDVSAQFNLDGSQSVAGCMAVP